MKEKYKIIKLFLVFTIIFSMISCNNNTIQDDTSIEVKTKFQKLSDEIFKNENVINATTSSKLISAEDVYNSSDKKNLILDIRGAKNFSEGHIKNSINLKMSELIDYAQVKGLPMYDKVILVCYTGQSAAYSSAVLQMLGHNNIYVMEWGMCSWNKKFSKKWLRNISDKGSDKLVKTDFPKNGIDTLPIIECKKNSGPEILYKRARELLKEGFGKSAVNANYLEAFAKKCYVISVQNEDLYKAAHLKNAIYYNIDKSFKPSTDLFTIPKDKTIVVYSNKGYKSVYIAVYLKMLGYDAKTLKYGANSFMNTNLLETKDAFSEKVIKNYPSETFEYIEVEGAVQEGGC